MLKPVFCVFFFKLLGVNDVASFSCPAPATNTGASIGYELCVTLGTIRAPILDAQCFCAPSPGTCMYSNRSEGSGG